MSEASGAIGIVAILAISVAIAWFLAYVAKVEWFRTRFLYGNRTERMIAMLPIVLPICLFYIIAVRPFFA